MMGKFWAPFILGLTIGFFTAYVIYLHSVPTWMFFMFGGVVGGFMAIMLLPHRSN